MTLPCSQLPRLFMPRNLAAPFLLMLLLFAGGCASGKLDRLLPHVETMQVARHYFGEPAAQKELHDGTVRYDWVVDRTIQAPGQYVEKRIFVGYDRDGFPKYVIREYFSPAHMERQMCRMSIIATKDGKVLSTTRQGDSCEALLRVRQHIEQTSMGKAPVRATSRAYRGFSH